MSIKLQIKGLKEIEKMLKQLPKDINDRVQYDLNRKVAAIAKKQMEMDAPEGNNNKKAKDKTRSNITIAKARGKGNRSGVWVGVKKRVWYSTLIDRGTKVRSTKGKGRYKKKANRGSIGSRPWIEQAHNKAMPSMINFINNSYAKVVNQSLKKQVKRFK